MNDDDLLWDMVNNSASTYQGDDSPTIITLYDTLGILEKREPNWKNDTFLRNILIWQSNLFLPAHVDEVCKDKCPEFLELCKEYREHGTIEGLALSPVFGMKALEFIFPSKFELPEHGRFECAPVRDCYFQVVDGR